MLRARLAAVVESSDDAIVSKSLEGVILTWNQGAQRIFGWTAEEVVGKQDWELEPHWLRAKLAHTVRAGADWLKARRPGKQAGATPAAPAPTSGPVPSP